jgi:hypothetical protein
MRKYLSSILLCFVCCSQSLAQSPSLTDYLRTAPAKVRGQIEFEDSHSIYRSSHGPISLITSGIRKDKPINFEFNEQEISLHTDKALYVSVAGIPVNITNITYDARTRKIGVNSSFFGTRLCSPLIEKHVRSEIQRQFGTKLQTAFNRLAVLRQQRSLVDTNNVLDQVVHAFDGDGKGTGLPSFHGDLSVVNPVARDITVDIDKNLSADLKAGDQLETTLQFRAPRGQHLQIKGLTFYSPDTIRLHSPKTSKQSIKAVDLRVLSVTEEGGFQVTATNGIDDTVSNGVNAGKVLVAFIKLAQHQMTGAPDCESITAVQQFINGQARTGLQDYIKNHRTELVRAGATPQLLRALETDSDPFRGLAEASSTRRRI